MIPLEAVPLPVGLQPGTQKYLDVFRATAVVREQFWIRHMNAGYPNGLNLEVHQGNPATRERRSQRRQSGTIPKPVSGSKYPFQDNRHCR